MENYTSPEIGFTPAWREMLQGTPCENLSDKDVNILNKAFRKHVAYVCQVCRLTLVSDIELVAARVEDTILSAAKKYEGGKASIITYLKAVMERDNCIRYFRAECRYAVGMFSLNVEEADEEEEAQPRIEPVDVAVWDPSAQADFHERQRRLQREPLLSAVVELLLAGIHKREIPARMGITDYRFRQLLERLKKILLDD